MAMWTTTQVGGQTIFQLEDRSERPPVPKLMNVLKQVCYTTLDTAPAKMTPPPLVTQVIEMAPPARLDYQCQEDTLTLLAEDRLAPTGRYRLIENSLGKITHSVDGSVITFEPKAGGSVTFVETGGKVLIIAIAPDGTERRYPATKIAFEAARRIRDRNVNWLGGQHFSFEPSHYAYKSVGTKIDMTVSRIEYAETGFVSGFSLPNGDRWIAVQGHVYFECLDSNGKRKSALPLQLGPIVMKEDGLHGHGLDAGFDIGVPLRRQAACGMTVFSTAAAPPANRSIKATLVPPSRSWAMVAWQKSARDRHLQSVATFTQKRKALAN
ncbi:MAG TPA: hypothetical protein V6C81_22040 [Planktothrix sp.]